MIRTPVEPDPTPASRGAELPRPFDFGIFNVKPREEGEKYLHEYVDTCIDKGLRLCSDDSGETISNAFVKHVPAKILQRQHILHIRVETHKVAGAIPSTLKAVRHIVKLPVPPRVLFDSLTRFCYTNAIDPFLNVVEVVDDFKPPASSGVSWCHVTYTQDVFAPFMSMRDFVSLDFASERHLLYFSRSCLHPDRQPGPAPAFMGSVESSAFRVPFQFCQHVIPDDEDPNSCTLIQFQFSDVGGMLSPNQQLEAIIRFGLKNIPASLELLTENFCILGPGKEGYVKDPLEHLKSEDDTTARAIHKSELIVTERCAASLVMTKS